MDFFIRLGKHVNHGERMNPIDFEGQRSHRDHFVRRLSVCACVCLSDSHTSPHIGITDLSGIVCFFIRLEQSVFNYRIYPRATLLWFRGSVRLSVRGPCECDRVYTVAYFFVKLGRHVNHDERMYPINFGGQRSKVKVTMDIYGNKLVNTIET